MLAIMTVNFYSYCKGVRPTAQAIVIFNTWQGFSFKKSSAIFYAEEFSTIWTREKENLEFNSYGLYAVDEYQDRYRNADP